MVKGTLPLPQPFSLGLTLLCGQCFRWDGPDFQGWFQGIAGQSFWRLRQEGDTLHWECSQEKPGELSAPEWLSYYFNLKDGLEAWAKSLEKDPVMGHPLRLLRGLRLARQDPWECTISYMFAQGLSVKIIRQALRKFCEKYGRSIPGAPGFYSFPLARDLSVLSPDALRPYTNNYRARADRVIRAARAVEARVISLEHLKGISCDEARESLMGLDGIGPKIADCILLFSLDHATAFPVDRWVLRAMKRNFKSVKLMGAGEEAPQPSQYLKIVQKARVAFGQRCGLASEYLFLFLRLKEDETLRRELAPFCPSFDFGGDLVPLSSKGRKARKTSRITL